MNRGGALLLINGLILSGCASGPEGPPHAPISIIFEQAAEGYIVIPVTIAGASGYAILDNGAPRSGIDTKFAQDHNLLRENEQRAGGGVLGKLMPIDVGGVQEQTPPIVIDLTSIRAGKPIIAIVGAEFFRSHVIDLDFTRKRLTFHDRRTFVAPPGYSEIRLTSAKGDGHVSMPASIEGESGYRLNFDLGGGGGEAGLKEGPLADRLAASRLSAPSGSRAYRNGTLTTFEGRLFTLREIAFGPFKLTNIPTYPKDKDSMPGADVRLDAKALAKFDIIFDIGSQRLWMRPNPAYDIPFEHDLIGRIDIDLTSGAMRVAKVQRGSPAEKAGLKVGDVIVRFEGQIPTVAETQALEVKEPPQPGDVIDVELNDGRTLRILAARFY